MLHLVPEDIIYCICRYLDFEDILTISKCAVVDTLYILKAYNPNIHTWMYAAQNNKIQVLKFLDRKNIPGCTAKVMDIAAEYGYLEIVKWLHYNRFEGCSTKAVDFSCINRHYKVVVFLYDNGYEMYKMGVTANFIILLENVNTCIDYLERFRFFSGDKGLDYFYQECIDVKRYLTNITNIPECYSNTMLLKIVYIGAKLNKKKYAHLIKEAYTRTITRAEELTECHGIVSTLG